MTKNTKSRKPDTNLIREMTKTEIKNPLSKLKEARRRIAKDELGVRDQLRDRIVEVYIAAMGLHFDRKERKEFYADKFFEERKRKPKDKDVLRMSFCYGFDALSGRRYDRVCTYTNALKPYFERGARPDEVQAALAEYGVEWLFNSARHGKESKHVLTDHVSNKTEVAPAIVDSHGTLNSTRWRSHPLDVKGTPGTVSGDSDPGVEDEKTQPRRRTRERSPTYPATLEVNARQDHIGEVLALDVRETIQVTLERLPSDLDWKWIVIKSIDK